MKIKRPVLKGNPIYKTINEGCLFCKIQKHKRKKETMKFPVCINPLMYVNFKKTGAFIISCPSNYKKCEAFRYSAKNKNDLLLIKRILIKNDKLKFNSIIRLLKEQMKDISDRVSIKDKEYVLALFNYFGMRLLKTKFIDRFHKTIYYIGNKK